MIEFWRFSLILTIYYYIKFEFFHENLGCYFKYKVLMIFLMWDVIVSDMYF